MSAKPLSPQKETGEQIRWPRIEWLVTANTLLGFNDDEDDDDDSFLWENYPLGHVDLEEFPGRRDH